MWRLFRNLWWYFWLSFFSNLPWHWCSPGSKKTFGEKTFVSAIQFFSVGETWVDPFFFKGGAVGFSLGCQLSPCHLDPPHKTAFMRSNSTLFKAASGFPWCRAKTCPREKTGNSPDSTRKQKKTKKQQKIAHNSAAPKAGIREVQVGLRAPRHEVEDGKKRKRKETRGRERKADEEGGKSKALGEKDRVV